MSLKITTALLKMGLLSAMLCCFAPAQESASSGALSLTAIIQEMEKAQTGVRPQAPYQVIREYRLFGANSSTADSTVVAEIDFRPPDSQNYNVQRRSGSSRGEQVVRRILDHEAEAAAKRDQPRVAGVTSDNYDFTYLGETVLDGQPCYLLGLKPKRKYLVPIANGDVPPGHRLEEAVCQRDSFCRDESGAVLSPEGCVFRASLFFRVTGLFSGRGAAVLGRAGAARFSGALYGAPA